MSARRLVASTIFTLAAGSASAGPYDQPWSEVEPGDNSDVRKEARLSITKVDGATPLNRRRSEPLAPGKHVVTVSYTTGSGVKHDPIRELQLELDACTRYRIVAQYESRMGNDWSPKVYAEPIAECIAKFKAGKGKAT